MDDHVYLEYSKGSSSKFWEATLVGRVVTFHWGKIGTKGQTHKKRFKTPEAAIAEFSKKARAKVRKGYVEIIPEEEESATPEPAREAASEPDEPESAVASVASTVTKSAVVEQSSPDTPVEPSPEDKKSSVQANKPEVAWTEDLLKLAGPLRDNLHTPIPERTAEQALEGRLLRSVHEPDDLVPAAQELARSFVRDRSPVALGLAKQMLYRNSALAHPLEAHLSDSLAMYWTSLGDGKEGVAAFREKRAPRFRGKASALPRIHPRG